MKKLSILFALMIAAAAFCLSGCGSSDESSDEKVTINVGYTDTETRSVHKAAENFKEKIEADTDGQVSVELYPNGTLGDDDELIKAVNLNTCQLYIGGTAVFAGQVGENLDVFDLPYMYDSNEAWENAVTEQGLIDLYNEQLEGTGYKLLDFEYDGMKELLTTKTEVKNLDDINGLKLRVNNTNLFLGVYKLLGANPTPVAYGEVYTALTNGTVDGVDHALGVFYDQKWYESAKAITMTDMFVGQMIVLTSDEFYNSLSEDIQEALTEAAQEMAAEQRDLEKEAEQEALDAMKDAGVEIIEMDDDAFKEYKAKAMEIYDTYKADHEDLVNDMLEIADKANEAVK